MRPISTRGSRLMSQPTAPAQDAAITSRASKLIRARSIPAARGSGSLEFNFALQCAHNLSRLAHYRHSLNLLSCLECPRPRAAHRARPSRVVTAALLSEVAEVVTLPDLRSEVPEDRVRNRDVEEEVGQH